MTFFLEIGISPRYLRKNVEHVGYSSLCHNNDLKKSLVTISRINVSGSNT